MPAEILVTTKVTPDLDGVSCALSYARLLGDTAQGIITGNPQSEVQYFITQHGIAVPTRPDDLNGPWAKFILVDASSMKGMPKVIRADQVVEIIDHREASPKTEFPHAKIQNDPIGAAATIVVERFIQATQKPTPDHAKLLYGAIFHNTLDLLASNTDHRDKAATRFLEENYGLNHQMVADMFAHSTTAILADVRKALVEDYKTFGSYVFSQLIVWGGDLRSHEEEIRTTLQELKQKSGSEWSILSTVDLEEKQNTFYAESPEAKAVLKQVFGFSFNGNWATLSPVLLRKQIYPQIAAVLK